MDAQQIKHRLKELGADLCGIAGIDRFEQAPKGVHPTDVLPTCQSVIVFAKRFLAGTLACNTTIPYTIVRNILSDQMDQMAVQFCTELENRGILAIPTGTNGPTEYSEETKRYRNIVSAKHAAVAAGLGTIGKNTLLITPQYGNMVWLSVILTELKLEADPLIDVPCCDNCNRCVDVCPSHALEEEQMEQVACWESAFGSEGKGEWRIKCFRCREVCPYHFGEHNKVLL